MDAAESSGSLVLDNSAWARIVLGRLPDDARTRWAGCADGDRILICDPFRLEALYSARSPDDYVALSEELGGFRPARADGETWRLALRAQAELAAARGVSHRVKIVDLLVAASAHQHGAGVLHYDRDFDLIEGSTSLEFASVWIAPRGSID